MASKEMSILVYQYAFLVCLLLIGLLDILLPQLCILILLLLSGIKLTSLQVDDLFGVFFLLLGEGLLGCLLIVIEGAADGCNGICEREEQSEKVSCCLSQHSRHSRGLLCSRLFVVVTLSSAEGAQRQTAPGGDILQHHLRHEKYTSY
ncbi:hypothetical protein FGO68_gene15321 [Halteria grandinella]|uniref:Uncharacterized protein n=1 Tax=Halteria grandinella TaxID=5974 RepID=A0A8J8SX79_HALGN|nr:hypothetical protein FGO68_gene15321 [Halteria grandinella]